MSKNKALIRKIIIPVILVLIASGWVIYHYRFDNNKLLTIQVNENQKNVTLKKNQEFTISLNSNKTTGYSWQLNDSYDKKIINFINSDYKTPNSTRSGAPGQELWNFKAIEKGNITLQFTYSRTRANNTTSIDTKIIYISVN